MKLILIFSILTILLIPISIVDINALQQIAGKIEVDIKPGETETFQWGLASDKTNANITVELSAQGEGSEFLSFEKSLTLEPKQMLFAEIVVNIPGDYPGNRELQPMLFATEFGEKGGATVIHIQVLKIVDLNIAPNDNPDLWVDWDTITTEEEIVMTKSESVSEDESEKEITGLSIIQKETESEQICGAGTELVNGICKVVIDKEPEAKGGGCLIATAAYGTELAPQVQFLREIRDSTVLSTASGTSFMDSFNQFYYSFSPAIADLERQNPIFKEAVKLFITPMISSLSIMTLADGNSETEVLAFGISVIALNLGMYIVAPTAFALKVQKHLKSRK